MKNWEVLQQEEYEFIWNFVRTGLSFHPYATKGNVVILPEQNKCFDTSNFFGDNFEQKLYDELHDVAQEWFKGVCGGQRMYALDWQHECYSFDPYLPFEKGQVFDEWPISVFPNGDYFFFLTHDFKNGIFGDGIHYELSFWGNEMVRALEINTPRILEKVG